MSQKRNWLNLVVTSASGYRFWSFFRKIHEATDLPPVDKFQYLLSAITQGRKIWSRVILRPPRTTLR